MLKKLLLVGFGCALTASALAETAGFQASLTPDIAVEDRNTMDSRFPKRSGQGHGDRQLELWNNLILKQE